MLYSSVTRTRYLKFDVLYKNVTITASSVGSVINYNSFTASVPINFFIFHQRTIIINPNSNKWTVQSF